MASNKVSSKLLEATDEELLDILKNVSKTDTFDTIEIHDDVANYLLHFKILPGKYLIKSTLLFKLYRHWSKNTVSRSTFSLRMNMYLLGRGQGNNKHYKINQNAFKLTEEIEKIVPRVNKTKSVFYRQHFEKFINLHNLKKGSFYLEGYILFNLYDKWTYINEMTNPLNEQQFHLFCKLFFNRKVLNRKGHVFYAINKEAIKQYLSQDDIDKLRQERQNREKENKKSNKEASKKKPTK